MGHKCFITFKTEDSVYKKHIQEELNVDMIDKSLNEPIDSDDEEYIMSKIRQEYLSDSTVTICLIGTRSSEYLGWEEQRFIKRELQASLYNSQGNSKSGILGVVLPSMYGSVYAGSGICNFCGNSHTYININDTTIVKEFSYNYYIPNAKCFWSEDDRYCVLVKWEDFVENPNTFIDKAFDKRNSEISGKTKVRP
jgi:hypothetical protein|tara:strand:+ start:46 stop:630 length:585 start_codon:yes stop_codon:yes gene_type:complete